MTPETPIPDEAQVSPDEAYAGASTFHTPVEIEHRLTSLETITEHLSGTSAMYERMVSLETTIANAKWIAGLVVSGAAAAAILFVRLFGPSSATTTTTLTTLLTTTTTLP